MNQLTYFFAEENVTAVNKDEQKRMIADQIEESRKVKEELNGESKEISRF